MSISQHSPLVLGFGQRVAGVEPLSAAHFLGARWLACYFPETIAILVAILAGIVVQIAGFVTLIVRGDTQAAQLRKELGGRIDETNRRLDEHAGETNRRLDDVNKRFDETIREIAEQRERMAKLEGSLDGFLADRRDGDAS